MQFASFKVNLQVIEVLFLINRNQATGGRIKEPPSDIAGLQR
jgi:hypothetical protein